MTLTSVSIEGKQLNFCRGNIIFCHVDFFCLQEKRKMKREVFSDSYTGEVSFFTGRGLCKFFKLCKFLVIPHCTSKIFLIPPDVLQNSSDSPPPHHHQLIMKAVELVPVFEAEIDHPLSLLKVKAENLRGILTVV